MSDNELLGLNIMGSFSLQKELENVLLLEFSLSATEDISNCGQLRDFNRLILAESGLQSGRTFFEVIQPNTFFTSLCTLWERKAYKMGENAMFEMLQIKAPKLIQLGNATVGYIVS